VTAAHAYADNGFYTVTFTVEDDDGGVGSDTTTVTVENAAPVVDAGPNRTTTEGVAVSITSTFTDAGVNDTHTATIDWGDGTAADTIDPAVSPLTGSHTYVDNGDYTVTVTVTDNDGGVGSDTLMVTVNNAAPVVDAGADQTADEGDADNPVAISATFTDLGANDTHTATIDWGDGTAADAVDPATSPVTGSHVYADNGDYTVTVTVTDNDGDSGSDTLVVTVSNVDPVVVEVTADDTEFDEGDATPVNLTATFTDQGADDTHTASIDWDDGTVEAGTVTDGTVTGSHVYEDNGDYTVTVTVTDDDGGAGDGTLAVTVNNLAPVVEAGDDQTADEGDTGNPVAVSATFTDPGTLDTHTATIDWGDGTAVDTVDPATSPVAGSHVYADNGDYTVTVTVTDDDGDSGSDTLTVTVNNVAPTVEAGDDQIANADIAVAISATFTDPGDDTYVATIDWGDGTVDTVDPATSPVDGTHVYTAEGLHTVTVTVTDDDGGEGQDTLEIDVYRNVPEAVAEANPTEVAPGQTVAFSHDDSFHHGYQRSIVRYQWDFENDGAIDFDTTDRFATPTHAYPIIVGTLSRVETARLVVIDDNDPAKTDEDTVDITVTFPNAAPIANANGPYVTDLGLGITVDGSGSSDPDAGDGDSIVSYAWDIDGDGTFGDVTGISVALSASELAGFGLDAAGTYTICLKVEDRYGATGTDDATVTLEVPTAVSASYNLLTTTLTIEFDKDVVASQTCYDGIGGEFNDSGNWDTQLANAMGLYAEQVEPKVVSIDINQAIAVVKSLAVAYLGDHMKVDLLLAAGAFTGIHGGKTLDQDLILDMVPGCGDVTGNGAVSSFDAVCILRSTVYGVESEIPIYGPSLNVDALVKSLGYPCNLMMQTADVSLNDEIEAYDAALTLRLAVGLPRFPTAPALSSPKVCRLNVNDYDAHRLEVSIDLNDVRDVYSADIVMTYDPSKLTVADVSKTSAVSEWLSADGAKSGKLRISLAGASEPVSNGSLVTVTFDGDGVQDAIKQLDITEFKLNGGTLKANVENLPKAFALLQNYPNPFNPETWIPYELSKPADVTISIFNVNGQMVRHLELGNRMPGHYVDTSKAAYWDGKNESGEMVSSGIYFYQLRAGHDAAVRKMIIVK
jgi:PKD repeat protein